MGKDGCCVGVFGDESETLGGDESSSAPPCSGGLDPRSDPEPLEDDDLLPPSGGRRCSRDVAAPSLCGFFTYVAWLDTDLVLKRDLLSVLDAAPDNDDTLDLGRSVRDLVESGVADRAFCCEVSSVSGGVGGRERFFELELELFFLSSGDERSSDLDRLEFEPRSVCRGVRGSVFAVVAGAAADTLKSSRLITDSLL